MIRNCTTWWYFSHDIVLVKVRNIFYLEREDRLRPDLFLLAQEIVQCFFGNCCTGFLTISLYRNTPKSRTDRVVGVVPPATTATSSVCTRYRIIYSCLHIKPIQHTQCLLINPTEISFVATKYSISTTMQRHANVVDTTSTIYTR